MFINEYFHNIDSKGRVIMPSKFRDEIGEEFYITKGMDECLFVYPVSAFIQMTEKLNKLSLTRRQARAFSRVFFSGASNQEIDKQGRFLIPQSLRSYADIKKEVAIIGVSNRIEIWDKEKWEQYSNDSSLNYDDLADGLNDLDL
ncbi:division/cell wall cluster transcriptional repressor MraZ [Finegoldia magna]|uniref:Transcriptional regulator MraZ n=1 Tax=Finegoldia magna (strain ATCC 29328 / DSM 20472 / WAL 2508) TaxID=334413 RepID=MRAZ_FINM2|nr:division/cell wall cluster transcriptional repressor MraZ [Finegoldia magna]B0S0Y8.1 RecName: Full=Transcriptional regulator MraZ [Finegoldia magna ATCC 29328]UEA70610.1 division/cell wall cluster transcriptional repressor MraZ [Finegoldia magna]BAG08028.1 conserved hypothetical protein [Finegoldia magna ATCC 29328]